MKIEQAFQDFIAEIEVRKYTPKTIRSYRNNLNLFLRFCEDNEVEEIEDVGLATVKKFTSFMSATKHKGTYINSLLKTVKSFINYCYEEGYGGFNTKKAFRWCKEEKPIIRTFQPEDVKNMLKSCKGSDFLSIRDTALLTTLFDTGIRCYEGRQRKNVVCLFFFCLSVDGRGYRHRREKPHFVRKQTTPFDLLEKVCPSPERHAPASVSLLPSHTQSGRRAGTPKGHKYAQGSPSK